MKEKSREFPRQVVTPKREMSRLVGFLIRFRYSKHCPSAASVKTDGVFWSDISTTLLAVGKSSSMVCCIYILKVKK
jgi:hypothetical protein